MTLNDTVILVTRNGMGHAPQDLQLTLIEKYLHLLLQQDELPAAICFYAEGVKLVTQPSSALEALRTLESKGVRLIVCSTCLDFFHLPGQVQVGLVGGMGDILEAQVRSGKVITL